MNIEEAVQRIEIGMMTRSQVRDQLFHCPYVPLVQEKKSESKTDRYFSKWMDTNKSFVERYV